MNVISVRRKSSSQELQSRKTLSAPDGVAVAAGCVVCAWPSAADSRMMVSGATSRAALTNMWMLDASAARSAVKIRAKCAHFCLSPDRGAALLSAASASAATGRGGRLFEIDQPSVNEHMLDRRALLEEVAVGDQNVRDLPLLERADPLAGAGDLRGVDRERADGGLGRQALLDRPRRVAHEIAFLAQTGRREGEHDSGLFERRRDLRRLRARAKRRDGLVGVGRERTRAGREVQAVD